MNKLQFQHAANLSDSLASRWFLPVSNALNEFHIQARQDIAMFIAQVGHESAGFKQLVENLNYTPMGLINTFGRYISVAEAEKFGRTSVNKANQSWIANRVYGGRLGNNTEGDGWRYRGRGLIQITGKDNYFSCSQAMRVDLISMPELLEIDKNAARSAAWFYTARGCLRYSGDIYRITRIINGGVYGLKERSEKYTQALSNL